jgi:hypothetical protein
MSYWWEACAAQQASPATQQLPPGQQAALSDPLARIVDSALPPAKMSPAANIRVRVKVLILVMSTSPIL